jgi:hypothetical protein
MNPEDGAGSNGIFIGQIGRTLGATSVPYQKVVSPYEVTESGKASAWYLANVSTDTINATLPDFGTDATIIYASDQGVTTLTGQTVSGSFNILRDTRLFAMAVFDADPEASVKAAVQDEFAYRSGQPVNP